MRCRAHCVAGAVAVARAQPALLLKLATHAARAADIGRTLLLLFRSGQYGFCDGAECLAVGARCPAERGRYMGTLSLRSRPHARGGGLRRPPREGPPAHQRSPYGPPEPFRQGEASPPAKSRTPALQHSENLCPPHVHPNTSFWALAVSSDTTGWVIFRSAVIAKNWAQQSFAGPMASRP